MKTNQIDRERRQNLKSVLVADITSCKSPPRTQFVNSLFLAFSKAVGLLIFNLPIKDPVEMLSDQLPTKAPELDPSHTKAARTRHNIYTLNEVNRVL